MKLSGGIKRPNPGEHIYLNLGGTQTTNDDGVEPVYANTVICNLDSSICDLVYPLQVEIQFHDSNVVVVSSLDFGIIASGYGVDCALEQFKDRADMLVRMLRGEDISPASDEWLGDINQIVRDTN